MSRLLSSPRRRRRLAWAIAALIPLAALVVLGVEFSNTAPKSPQPTASGGWVPPPEQKSVHYPATRMAKPYTVASKFVATAVARHDVASSWEITAPSLRQGMTRSQWASGDIPVVPFPVAAAKWWLDYSYPREVGFKVGLFPKKGSDVRATIFFIDLKAFGRGKGQQWLVESFVPGVVRGLGSSPSQSGAQASGLPDLGARRASGSSQLSAAWLLVPVGFFSLVLLIPLGVGINHWYRGARAERAYARRRAGLDV